MRDPKSGKILAQIVIRDGQSDYAVGGDSADPPHNDVGTNAEGAEAFLETLNQGRKERGLSPMRLDPVVGQAAQPLANHMAEFDICSHDGGY
ncbi:hypothetical protein IV102_27345 [bacterium]|nr:hypothetical protein [bacterium]